MTIKNILLGAMSLGVVSLTSTLSNEAAPHPKQEITVQTTASRDPLDQRLEEFSRKWNIKLRIDEEIRKAYSDCSADITFMKSWVDELDGNLERLNPRLLRNVTEIVVDNMDGHGYNKRYYGISRYNDNSIGMHVMCIGDINCTAHEFAHHYFFNTPGFQEQWNNIVNLEPNSPEILEYKRNSLFTRSFGLDSRYGFLDIYGTTSNRNGWVEDPATYIGEIYSGGDTFLAFRNIRDRSNHRYEQKLELLLYSGAITREQFEGAMNNLGIGKSESEEIQRIEAIGE